LVIAIASIVIGTCNKPNSAEAHAKYLLDSINLAEAQQRNIDSLTRLNADIPTVLEVKIGNQVWMTKNLNVDTFCNGDYISESKSYGDWIEANRRGQPAWCYYKNDPANGATYGKIYNFYAVADPRGLAPRGWHIPSDKDWTILTNYLGVVRGGIRMKSKRGWNKSGNGNNESGFCGLPAGYRDENGAFFGLGDYGYWWRSNVEADRAWVRRLSYSDSNVDILNYVHDYGFAVRCLRD
jgi:uncharacterized protein (TIGR02145 family)